MFSMINELVTIFKNYDIFIGDFLDISSHNKMMQHLLCE